MTVTIAYLPELPADAPHYLLDLPRAAVEAIAAAAVATPGYEGLNAQDDFQYGTYAYEVTGDMLACAARAMDMPTALALAPYAWHLRRNRFTAKVSTQAPCGWGKDQPHLMVNSEAIGAPSADWNASRARDVLDRLGLAFDSAEGAEYDAADLAARCEESLDLSHDDQVTRILTIARYALKEGGPGAVVTAG